MKLRVARKVIKNGVFLEKPVRITTWRKAATRVGWLFPMAVICFYNKKPWPKHYHKWIGGWWWNEVGSID